VGTDATRVQTSCSASVGDAAVLASQYVGGSPVTRDHKGDKGGRDPITPIAGAKQRECLKFLADQILSEKSFQFSPALLRRLGTEKWYHWGSDGFKLRRC